MSVLHPRNRLVNFRLSEDEFEKLKASCDAFGARSISDFARSSVLSRLEQADRESGMAPVRVGNLDNKVMELETRVTQLMRLIEVTGASPSAEHHEELVTAGGNPFSRA